MSDGTGLNGFRKQYRDRFFDVGIAEEHAVTFAAGLAANGHRPAVAIYSTFLQRAYDNIIHDVELQKLPVTFFIDRAGMNLSDGPTHYGVFDVAFLSQLPDMPIYTPVTKASLRIAMGCALSADRAVAVRYPNGTEDPRVVREFYGDASPNDVAIRSNFMNKGIAAESLDGVIVTHGRIVGEALKATDLLAEQGMRVGILLLEQIAPYSEIAEQLVRLLPQKSISVMFLEEEIKRGGMGMLMYEAMKPYAVMENKTILAMALEDPFCVPAKGQNCFMAAGLDGTSIAERLKATFSEAVEALK
jgi:1-deoxy-D-xylulose-5-phosphate synthase